MRSLLARPLNAWSREHTDRSLQARSQGQAAFSQGFAGTRGRTWGKRSTKARESYMREAGTGQVEDWPGRCTGQEEGLDGPVCKDDPTHEGGPGREEDQVDREEAQPVHRVFHQALLQAEDDESGGSG